MLASIRMQFCSRPAGAALFPHPICHQKQHTMLSSPVSCNLLSISLNHMPHWPHYPTPLMWSRGAYGENVLSILAEQFIQLPGATLPRLLLQRSWFKPWLLTSVYNLHNVHAYVYIPTCMILRNLTGGQSKRKKTSRRPGRLLDSIFTQTIWKVSDWGVLLILLLLIRM